jgi:AraC-like DNA-binding protein
MFQKRKDSNLRFFVFPQLGATIRLCKNTKVYIGKSKIKLKPITGFGKNGNSYFLGVAGKYIEPMFFNYEGYVDGFAINFNSIGINYFFNKSYKKIAPKNFQGFSDRKWYKFAEELFAIEDFNGRVEFAEAFLESIFNNLNITEIEKAIVIILKDQTISVSELASICCMSNRNFLRKFTEYVGCSPVAYKRIVRFRKSIDFNIWKEQNMNCTDISNRNNYYDTAHFRKEFIKLTHQNPIDFFKTISALGNHKLPFKIV